MEIRPWQIVALATLCFIQAVHLLEVSVSAVLEGSSHANVVELAEFGIGGDDVNSVYDHLDITADIFGLMSVVVLMFGILLYRGQYLPAVRLTGTIYSAVGIIGLFFVSGSVDEGTVGATNTDNIFQLLFTILLLAGFVSLFFGKSAKWVNEHRN